MREVGLNYAVHWVRYTAIFYRPEVFEVVDSDYILYPETMEGYEGSFNDVRSKSLNLAVLRVKETGKLLIVGVDAAAQLVVKEPLFQQGKQTAGLLLGGDGHGELLHGVHADTGLNTGHAVAALGQVIVDGQGTALIVQDQLGLLGITQELALPLFVVQIYTFAPAHG
jgi:hypothetical protein